MSMRTVIDAVKACLKNTETLENEPRYQAVIDAVEAVEASETRLQIADNFAVALFELLAIGVQHDLPVLDCFAALHENRFTDREGQPDAEKLQAALLVWDERKKSMSGRHLELREETDVLSTNENNT